MFRFLVFILFTFSIWSRETALAVSENDPSSIVNGVSVITGDLYLFEEDYVVQGAEPINIHRTYMSRDGCFIDFKHLTAEFRCFNNCFAVNEPNGTIFLYYADSGNNVFPVIGDNFFGLDKKKRKTLKYNALSLDDKGTANTKSGEISGKTNVKNQYLQLNPDVDKKGKSFTLHASDGTIRKYINFLKQKKTKGPYGEDYLAYYYKLVSETLPNGHMIHYKWDNKNRLDKIYTTNLSQTKTFASLSIPAHTENPPIEIHLTGSDLRSITYQAHPTEMEGVNVMCKVLSPEYPTLQYGWDVMKTWVGKVIKIPYLASYTLPKSRTIYISYDDTYDHRVKELKAPLAKNASMVRTHLFEYDQTNKKSNVTDAQGNKTWYFWNDDYRLTKIAHYVGDNSPYCSELFNWENNLLKCKTLLDEKGAPIHSYTYLYDSRGNVKEKTLYGNLSGQGAELKVDPSGIPIAASVENFTERSSFSDDGKNLPTRQEGSNGLVITYSYWGDTHLTHMKSVYDGYMLKIRYTHEYDSDCILKKEIIDDGVSKRITLITPCPDTHTFVGMPQTIEEMYEENSELKSLKKTVIDYGAGATIKKKEIYDANGNHRYTLEMEYDEKGRLTSETNAIGQRAIYKYDEVGNKYYERDFSCRLEIFYEYDFGNRLIKKEEKGFDGVYRCYKFDYDTKHNLISETDPYGNETIYVPDAFGNRKEIHYPFLENENGETSQPIVYQKFDSAGNLIEKTDAEGNVTTTKYNAYKKPYKIIHPDKSTEQFSYFLDGNLKSHTDEIGITTEYTYDYLSREISRKTVDAIEIYEYEGISLKKKIDAEKNETTYGYDGAGRKKSESHANETIIYQYDELGRVWKTEKGDLLTIKKYDLLDRIIEESNESEDGKIFKKVRYEYDAAGNQTAIIRNIDGKESREEFTYDSVGRLIEKKDALGFIETWKYDSKINQKLHTDPMGLQTIETYNGFNKLSTLEKRKNGQTLFLQKKFYNKNGQIALQIDTIYQPDGSSKTVCTKWEYDSRGLLKTLTEGEGSIDAKATCYTYTPRKELETITKPSGVVLYYQYNEYGHLESLTSSDSSVNHTMKYNLLGQLRESDELSRELDAFGRILSETFPVGIEIENSFDSQGRRETCTITKANCLISYEHDPAHLIAVTRKTIDAEVLYRHAYLEYDLSGNVIHEKRIDEESSKSAFDLLNRRYAISSFPLTQEVLGFDSVGNILKMRKAGIGYLEYTYDDLYQLTSERGQFNHDYIFDSNNNRLNRDGEKYEINALNQITSHFEYDLNGNPIQHQDTTYAYDALDRLVRIETPEFIQTFTYDFFHRCLSKTTLQGGEENTVYFLYDGQNEIGSFDDHLNPIELRILGSSPHAEIGAAIAIELVGKIHVPIHDLHGNLAVLKPLDSVPTFYHYTAFGEEIIAGESISPWRFSSKRTDDLSHLVYFGRRFYVPSFGRWLTPDPAGFTDGMNLYAYVHNNPLTHFDEYGLWDAPPLRDAPPLNQSLHRYYSWNRSLYKPPPFTFGRGMNPTHSPMFYVNGILNTKMEAFGGACTLNKTMGWRGNVTSIYSKSRGYCLDLDSVHASREKPNYTSDAVVTLKREIEWAALCLDALNDPRKIFITAFSRGCAETYHATKDLPQSIKDRLIITACGPIMILPRNLGFKVTNIISRGDWCSLHFHKGLKKNPREYDAFADVILLPQQDGFSGFIKDHFFRSKTYQSGIDEHTVPLYKQHGVSP